MEKIIKPIFCIFCILFIFLALAVIVADGGAGSKVQYYYFKSIYRILNPENKPSADIIIDLKQGYDFIIKNAKPTGWLHLGSWGAELEKAEQETHLLLQTEIYGNPFEYFKVKIMLDETELTIADAKIIFINFNDYKNPEYRIKYPMAKGINSVQIFCMDGHPRLVENDRMMNYNFALVQHQKLTAMLTDAKFIRDVLADENINKSLEEKVSGTKYFEYKRWTKGNFKFTLILELSDKGYINSIYIYPKDHL